MYIDLYKKVFNPNKSMKGKIAMYSLKLFNNTLVKFDMENKPTLKIFNINVVSNDKKLFP